MGAGNDATFTGNGTSGANSDWSTEYPSQRRDATQTPVTLACVFDATGLPPTAAGNLASAYNTKAESENLTQRAAATGATVAFTPDGVTGMTVGSGNSPVSTNANTPSDVGTTGLGVYKH